MYFIWADAAAAVADGSVVYYFFIHEWKVQTNHWINRITYPSIDSTDDDCSVYYFKKVAV